LEEEAWLCSTLSSTTSPEDEAGAPSDPVVTSDKGIVFPKSLIVGSFGSDICANKKRIFYFCICPKGEKRKTVKGWREKAKKCRERERMGVTRCVRVWLIVRFVVDPVKQVGVPHQKLPAISATSFFVALKRSFFFLLFASLFSLSFPFFCLSDLLNQMRTHRHTRLGIYDSACLCPVLVSTNTFHPNTSLL